MLYVLNSCFALCLYAQLAFSHLFVCQYCSIDCQYLEGYVGHCDDFLQPEFSYFTNYSTALAHESTAGKLMSAIDSILLNKSCRSLAYAMVCNTLYAPCDVQPGLPSPRMICPSACEEFSKSGDCAGLIGPEHEDVYAYVSQCDASGNEAGDSPECVPLSLEAPRIGKAGDSLCGTMSICTCT